MRVLLKVEDMLFMVRPVGRAYFRRGSLNSAGTLLESVLNPGKEGHLLTLDTHSGPLKEGQRILMLFLSSFSGEER